MNAQIFAFLCDSERIRTYVECSTEPITGVVDKCATVESVLFCNAWNAIVDDNIDATVLVVDRVARALQLYNI